MKVHSSSDTVQMNVYDALTDEYVSCETEFYVTYVDGNIEEVMLRSVKHKEIEAEAITYMSEKAKNEIIQDYINDQNQYRLSL